MLHLHHPAGEPDATGTAKIIPAAPTPRDNPEYLALLAEQGAHLTGDEAALVAAWCGIGIHPVGHLAREDGRFVLRHPDGTISNKFGLWENREDITAALATAGLQLRDDNAGVRS